MINFRVADRDGLRGKLRSEGVTFDERTEKSEFGYFGWALDPEGNRIDCGNHHSRDLMTSRGVRIGR